MRECMNARMEECENEGIHECESKKQEARSMRQWISLWFSVYA